MNELENENIIENEEPCSVSEEICKNGNENETNKYQVSEISVANEAAPSEESVEIEEQPKKEKKSAIAFVYDYLETFCFALALMMLLFLFVFRYVSVDGDSMLGTLHNGDKLIISNLFYAPETGDIVVINPESHGDSGEPIIKRVIATEGQTVYIDYANWAVYVDGVKLDEPYIEEMRAIEMERWGDEIAMNGTSVNRYKSEFTVEKGKVFVMGDNRNHSKDSRSREYGEMGVNRILGRVIFRITPEFGTVD